MNIQIKRVYEEPDAKDGKRILVDRLWPRGLSKERAALTLWLKEIRRARNCPDGSATIPHAGRNLNAAIARN